MLLMTQRFEVMLEKLCLRGDRERDLPLLFIGERDRSLKNTQGKIDKLKSSQIGCYIHTASDDKCCIGY